MKKNEMQKIFNEQKEWYYKGRSLSTSFKIKVLTRLKKAIIENIAEIHLALSSDLGIKNEEYCFYETSRILMEINRNIRSLKLLSSSKNYESKGTTLIISGKYSPFINSISPLIKAILRGDVCFIKPGSKSKETSLAIKNLLDKAFPDKYVYVISESHKSLKSLLSLDFDYVYFSGTKEVAKEITVKCAKKLIPYDINTYEPKVTFVTKKDNLKKTARDFVLDKFIDCGQYHNSPDYIIIEDEAVKDFSDALICYIEMYVGSDPLIDDNYGKICDKYNYDRLLSLIREKETLYGGAKCDATLQIGPVILFVREDDPIIKEKIFGPIIPIVKMDNIDFTIYRKNG